MKMMMPRRFVSIVPVLALFCLVLGVTHIPHPVLAQENALEVQLDESNTYKIIKGSDPSGSDPSNLKIAITNRKNYYLQIEVSTSEGASKPAPLSRWARAGILPPLGTVEYRISFDEPGQRIMFRASAGTKSDILNLHVGAILNVMGSGVEEELILTLMQDVIDIAMEEGTSPQQILEEITRTPFLPEVLRLYEAGRSSRTWWDLLRFSEAYQKHVNYLTKVNAPLEGLVMIWAEAKAERLKQIAQLAWEGDIGFADMVVGILGEMPFLGLVQFGWAGIGYGNDTSELATGVSIEYTAYASGERTEPSLNPSFALQVQPLSGLSGTPFEVSGHGFTAGNLQELVLEKPDGFRDTMLYIADELGRVQTILSSENLGPGTYSVWIIDWPTSQRSIERTFTITAPPGLPDLTVTSLGVVQSGVRPGAELGMSFTLANGGRAPAGPFVVWVCLSTRPYGTDTVLAKVPMDSLHPGTSKTVDLTLAMPPSVDPGEYYVTVFADAPGLGVVTEDAEDNNIGSSSPQRLLVNAWPSALDITVLSPNGGEQWPAGRARTIAWDSSGLDGNIWIELSRNGGLDWETIVTSTPSDGSEWWTVTGPPTTQAKIRVISEDDASIFDSSDGNFSILQSDIWLSSPNGGENWEAGNTYVITWSISGDVTTVRYFVVKYSLNQGATWTNIARLGPSSRSLDWTIPARVGSSQCRVAVRALDAEGWVLAEDSSDSNFTISSDVPTSAPAHLFPANRATGVSTRLTFQWQAVSGATKYGLYVSKPPYGEANLVYENESVTGTSLTLPITLGEGVTYHWNMRAGNDAGWGPFSSSWSFTTEQAAVNLTLYVHEGSASGPVISGARVTGEDGAGVSFDKTTNSSGYVTITGAPGTWSFTASKSGYETNSWSQSITSTTTKHAYLIKQVTNVNLTLYVHENSASGPVISGARVTGNDAAGNSFDQTTNSNGYVTITGVPGTWSFTASKSGYQTNSWSQSISTTSTKHAYLIGEVMPPSPPTLVDVGIASESDPWPPQTFLQARPGDRIMTWYTFSYSGPNMLVRLKTTVLDSNGNEIGNQITSPGFQIINPFENPIRGVGVEYKLSDEAIPGMYGVKFSIWNEADTQQYDSVLKSGWLELALDLEPETITTPDTPTEPSVGEVNQSLTCSTGGASSSLGHSLDYRFDWGDGSYSNWSSSTTASHSWSSQGTYTVRAQARCAIHTSVASEWSSGLSVTVRAPSLPGSFTLSGEALCDGNSPYNHLSWASSSGTTSYAVYRNGNHYYNLTTLGTAFNNTEVTAGTTCTYFIRATNATGSTDSNTVTLTTRNNCGPSLPDSFTLSGEALCDGNNPYNHLSWAPSSGATSYAVYRNGSLYYNLTTLGTTFENTEVTPGTTYTYFIRAANEGGSTDSNTVTITTRSDCGPTAKFNIGDRVRVTTNLNVRTGAGTGYPEITDPDYPSYAPEGTTGTVLSGPVSANGYIWWQIQYDAGYTGWSAETWLEPV